MELFYRKTGAGRPLILLHGLFGSSDNWFSIARELSASFEVYLIDQRNHGNSPHDPVHTFEAMCDDLHEFFERHHLSKASILGHSMGGKTAMFFALKYPQLVDKLIIVDISPLGYETESHIKEINTHKTLLNILLSLDLSTITTRTQADDLLAQKIASPVLRQFLLKNLKRSPEGKYLWTLNLNALASNMDQIYIGIDREENKEALKNVDFPVLFIKGEYSPYIQKHDAQAIQQYFPEAKMVTIRGAGHWLHAEQPAILLKTLHEFMGR